MRRFTTSSSVNGSGFFTPLWTASSAFLSTIGFANAHANTQPPTPYFSPLDKHTTSSTSDISDTLTELLEDGTHRVNKFKVKLEENKDSLDSDDVKQLANQAIKTGHAEELDALAGTFPQVINDGFIQDELQKTKSSSIFRELLVANADKKIQHVARLFNPSSNLSIVEEDDTEQLGTNLHALSSKPKKKIAVVNSDLHHGSHFFVSRAEDQPRNNPENMFDQSQRHMLHTFS